MNIRSFKITRFQFARDRVIGDSQVRADEANLAALELISDSGLVGLGFFQALFVRLPRESEITRVFEEEIWPTVEGMPAIGLIHRISRPRGGNFRQASLPFHEALQVALWDLAAKEVNLPLYQFLGAGRKSVKAYASGLDFHLDDDAFMALFAHAAEIGYQAFKIKVGHPDFERDLHRLSLLKSVIPANAAIMVDANEAWTAKEAAIKIAAIQKAGHDLLWVEDPILRSDFAGLRQLRQTVAGTCINTGEYLDLTGKRLLLEADAADMVNVHGQVGDVMKIGWLAAEKSIPVTMGNTFLEVGIHMAAALPEVGWIEYSFQNFDHLVDQPVEISNGWAHAPDRPGHGLVLSNEARARWARPEILRRDQLGDPPANPRLPLHSH